MKEIKALIVSYSFPPFSFPRSIQVYRLLKSLSCSFVVVCGDDPFAKKDETIAPDLEMRFPHIIRVPLKCCNFMDLVDSASRKLGPFRTDIPDAYKQWVLRAYQHFCNWERSTGYSPDLIITFGQPMSDHLFGLYYKKCTNTPWIAHFSDPWVDNPYSKYNVLSGFFNRRLERQVIEKADAVLFTSPETISLEMKKYPRAWRERAFYIPHIINHDLYVKGVIPPEDDYVIRSIGNFYGDRSPEPFFRAVEEVMLTMPDLFNQVIIEFVGNVSGYKKILEKYPNAKKTIRLLGPLPLKDSIQMMQTAHCLLIIDACSGFSVFFPSKLADYIGAQRFIFALSPKGTTARIVEEAGGYVADPSDRLAILSCLKRLLSLKPRNFTVEVDKYSPEVVGKTVMDIIRKVTSGTDKIVLD